MTDFPDIKLKSLVSFPATILDGTGIDVVKQNGSYQFNLAFDDFSPPVNTVADPINQNALIWNSFTGAYSLVSVAVLTGSSSPSDTNPVMDGVAAPGVSLTYSRGDHVHPSDTSRAPLASPTFTGDPKAPTPAAGDNDTSVATTAFVSSAITAIGGGILRSYLAGLTLSTAGSSTTFGIAVGTASDSTNVAMMTLASAFTKTTATWVVGSGNGGLDTGSITASAWYYVFLIQRPDTGNVDILISLAPAVPVMPTNYTLKRRIGAMLTNGSSQWTFFHQLGDEFLWDTAANNVNGAAFSTTAASVTLTAPTSIQTNAIIYIRADFVTNPANFLVSSPDTVDRAPTNVDSTLAVASTSTPSVSTLNIRTSAIGTIRVRANNTGPTYIITTIGWIDRRGRDA